MKKFYSLYIVAAIILFAVNSASGQNIPDGTVGSGYFPMLTTFPNSYPSPPSVNFVRNWTPLVPVTDSTSWALNAPANYKVVTSYLNGVGQTLQTNLRGTTTPDIISANDNRPSLTQTSFLPFTAPAQSHFLLTPFLSEQSFYQNYWMEQGATYGESITSYDNNVLTQRSFQPGAAFVGQQAGHTVRTVYNDTDQIILFNDDPSYPHTNGYYPAGMLTVKISTDSTPDHRQESSLREYYDKDNRLICKRVSYMKDGYGKDYWLNTYYVYNDKGWITFMIPPSVNPSLTTNMLNVIASGLCYRYVYDMYGNIIQKFVPNKAGFENTVYDRKHRPVLFQSALLAQRHQWHFNIYDSRGRIRMSGVTTIVNDQATWTTLLDVPTVTQDGSLIDYLVNEFHDNYPAGDIIPDCDVQVVNYYDRYDWNSLTDPPFATDHAPYYMTGTGTVTPVPYMLAQGLLTASKIKVLDNDTAHFASDHVISVYFYDKKANLIQTQTLNAWNHVIHDDFSDWDIATTQYNFAGQKIAEMLTHHWMAATVKPATFIQKHYDYDVNNGGHLTNVTQNIDNTGWMTISTYTYDNLGRVLKKSLGNVEEQNYTYNIRGQLQGLNEAYTTTGANPNSDITFGCKLGYDFGFSTKRYDGKVSGYFWRGAGQYSPQRAYGYDYDLAGRMTNAEFREYTDPNPQLPLPLSPVWNKVYTDYTAWNIRYDDNSNLLTMNQRGVGLVNAQYQPVDIDRLSYFYYHDKLTSVRDAISINYHLGDFINVECQVDANTPPDDINTELEYYRSPMRDSTSNNPGDSTTSPRNPADSSTYNPSDSTYNPGDSSMYSNPGDTTSHGSDSSAVFQASIIRNNTNTEAPPYLGDEAFPTLPPPACSDYRYDGNGNLIYDLNKGITSINYNHQDLPLQVYIDQDTVKGDIKNIYDASGTLVRKIIHNSITNTTDSFSYCGPLVYRNDSLLYILHDEGRTRWDAGTNAYSYDYFVKDHLGNVRTTVTAEAYDPTIYVATHEIAVANLEASIFDNIDQVRSDRPSPGPSDTKAIELYGDDSSKRIGTAILLRTMVGDKFDIDASSYFEEDSMSQQCTTAPSVLSSLFSALAAGVNPVGGSEGRNIQTIFNSFDPNNFASAYQNLLDQNVDSTVPVAYLNFIAFDDQMNMLPDNSAVLQVQGPIASWQNMALSNLNTMANGYVLVFLSNASYHHVFFDKLRIHFYKGHLAQEQHYYPYGLTINMGQAPGLPNKFQYQGKLMQDDFGLNLYDFHARQYDPQIGRFWGIDPADQFPNGYTGMGSDPANNVDPNGMLAEGIHKTIVNRGPEISEPSPTDIADIQRVKDQDKMSNTIEKMKDAKPATGTGSEADNMKTAGIGLSMTSLSNNPTTGISPDVLSGPKLATADEKSAPVNSDNMILQSGGDKDDKEKSQTNGQGGTQTNYNWLTPLSAIVAAYEGNSKELVETAAKTSARSGSFGLSGSTWEMAGGGFTIAGVALTVYGVSQDIQSYNHGEIGIGKLGYRIGSAVTSTAVGFYDPWAGIGVAVGGVVIEKAYDSYIDNTSKGISNFQHNITNWGIHMSTGH